MSIGDVHSDARGSGARFNDGKAPLHLIPLELIADSFDAETDSDMQIDVSVALGRLGSFQTGRCIDDLNDAIATLLHYWRDCAAVFDYGRKKYAEWNWAKGMAWSIPLACAARHALAALEGEDDDRESGLPHVGHMLCNLVMLRTFVNTYAEGDDLPPARLFARMPPSPDYDPDSVAFRRGDALASPRASMDSACAGIPAACRRGDLGWIGELATSDVCAALGRTAAEIADADGCMEYGNPVTPGCAPWRLP